MVTLLENNRLTADGVAELRKHADMVDCECPTHLLHILERVREFEAYTRECISKFPKDEKTHRWLLKSAENIDTLLSGTVVQLARLEGFVNEKNEFIDR